MNQEATLLMLACSATAHLVITCAIGVYARHKVQYLCLAWINGIFGVGLIIAACFSGIIAAAKPAVLHPTMLLVLSIWCYLQSIYPLSIPMPGFLQWQRMVKYATPVIILSILFGIVFLVVNKPFTLTSLNDVWEHLISLDIPLRLAALFVSIYYILNIFLLPRRMAHKAEIPAYLVGYSTAMGLSVIFYIFLGIFYSPQMLTAYIIIFTLLNLYLAFRTLDNIAITLPKPTIEEIKEDPASEVLSSDEMDDFNEANLQRFKRIQYWMQNHKSNWMESTFGRDNLCEATGYNRHLLLQSVRSQGYNNTHDYINAYRIEELKRLISKGEIRSVSQTLDVGFGTTKTARSCFLRMEDVSLDEYITSKNKQRLTNTTE